ncbi:MAG TPA: hypothetical protein VHP33_30170 [Polyangiaceae bacterium]|nr:hypothetical protein [Polyangiaceae bacterium]
MAFLGAWIGACTSLESGSDTFQAMAAGGAAGESSVAGATGANPPGAGAGGGGGGDLGVPSGGGSAGDAQGGDGPTACPPLDERKVEIIGGAGEVSIEVDTTWSCERAYELAGNVIVGSGATLRVDPGTIIRVGERRMLLVQRGARLEAAGTADQPITFTSAKPEGSRAPGDYRGVILIGDAPSHRTTTAVHDSLSDSRAHYGGGQAGDPQGSCGTLRYVRIEFAGGSIDDLSLPAGALTLAGCGAGTVVDYVQVQRGTDGVGLLGGNVGLRHLVVTNNLLGEAVEWSAGYTGTMQFVVAQSLGASAAMQGSNSADDEEASPVSRPSIYNATLVGSAPLVTGQHLGFVLQFGSRAVFKNSLIQGFADAAFDLRLSQAILKNELGAGKSVDISHVLLNGNAAAYSAQAQALSSMQSMRTQEPGLRAAANPTLQMPDAEPLFAPQDPTVNTDPASVPTGFDGTAGYRGAVPQDGLDWTQGWTRFPTK